MSFKACFPSENALVVCCVAPATDFISLYNFLVSAFVKSNVSKNESISSPAYLIRDANASASILPVLNSRIALVTVSPYDPIALLASLAA